MLDQVLFFFDITPDYDLDLMKPGQNLYGVTARILTELTKVLEIEKPDLVLVHGDTNTTLSASLASFYQKILLAMLRQGYVRAIFIRRGQKKLIVNLQAHLPLFILRQRKKLKITSLLKMWMRKIFMLRAIP